MIYGSAPQPLYCTIAFNVAYRQHNNNVKLPHIDSCLLISYTNNHCLKLSPKENYVRTIITICVRHYMGAFECLSIITICIRHYMGAFECLAKLKASVHTSSEQNSTLELKMQYSIWDKNGDIVFVTKIAILFWR